MFNIPSFFGFRTNAVGIFAAYAVRVAADGGVTESGSCVDAVGGISLDGSLLLIPSGYKASKVYCEIPTDGSGDLSFTRALDTATRVGSDGLIEKVRTNLVLNSAVFVTQTITVDANPHTLSFTGTGTIVITGVGSGTLVGTGANDRVSLAITTTAGGLILTLTGTATLAQLETGDIATPYIPTTTAAVSVGMLANVPRLDYLGGGCPKLLLEPQRTNLVTFSEQIDNAAWLKSAGATTITANTSTSPSGFQDADTWTINSAGARFVHQTRTMTAGAVTASFFVKKGTSDFFFLRIADGATNAGFTFDVANGTLGQSNSVTLVPIPSIEDYGNGWYRCSVTTTVVGTSIAIQGFVATSATQISGVLNASLICWGAQLEQGSYATSYIPTLGAAVTRSADAASKTGISALIGQTEGTLFAEVDIRAFIANEARIVLYIRSATDTNRVTIDLPSNVNGNVIQAALRANSVFQAVSSTAVFPIGIIKIAFAYSSANSVLYLNGNAVAMTSNNAFTFSDALSVVDLGGRTISTALTLNDGINQALLFKTRLTNAQLASLTTL